MANSDNAPLKPYNLAGYVISKAGAQWRAVDPKTGAVKYTNVYQAAVDNWAEQNKLK